MLLGKKGTEDQVVVNESYTVEADGLLLAVAEGYADMQDVHEFISGAEQSATVQVLHEGASLEVLQEGFAGDLYDKIVAAVKKLWGKIKGFFANVIRFFEGIFMSGKKFAEKYEDMIKEKDLGKFKFTMFDYTLDKVDIKNVFTKIRAAATKPMFGFTGEKEIKDAKKQVKQAAWGVYVSGAGSEEQFSRGLYKLLRGGKEAAREITPKVSELIAVLKDNEYISDVKDAAKDADDNFNDFLEKIEDARKAAQDGKKDDVAKQIRARHANFLEAKAIGSKVFSMWEAAAKEYLSAAKSCIVKAASYKEAKD